MPKMSPYNGSITGEQFLFYEIRICSRLYLKGLSVEQSIEKVTEENLFRYPTERSCSKMTRACYKRLDALANKKLIQDLSNKHQAIAKQINLYAIMRQNRLVREFMISLIGEKYRNQDFTFSEKDINVFLSRLQAQDEKVAGWSDLTIKKVKSTLKRMLIEVEILDNSHSEKLNPIFICEELEQGIKENNDMDALAAFNCFK